ncbi:MAG: hypothetical protein HRU17_17595 [Polyangiaceae bacterium]|nr:hypothetical protein [Polyangiaceae bacterium]
MKELVEVLRLAKELPTADRAELAYQLLDTVDDDLTREERAELHKSLERGLDDVKAGRLHDADEVLAELRATRHQRTGT